MTKILIPEKIDPICPQLLIEAGFEVDHRPSLTPEELLAIVGDYEGMVVRSSTKVTADIIARAAKMKIIGRAGAGVDTIDVPAATAAKIIVMNTPGQNSNGVAELVFGLMLALVRHVVTGCVTLKEGRWEKNKLAGTELIGKTLGLIGLGYIGRRVSAIAQGFGMNVLACDPMLDESQIQATGAKPTCLDEILAGSDFISLHLPKTKDTANLINAAAIEKMKTGAILINCARGGLVDENALAEALKNGRLAGAGFDVFATEPPAADNPLLALDNFIATPHLGASTAESQVNVAVAIARQISAYFSNGALDGAVNTI